VLCECMWVAGPSLRNASILLTLVFFIFSAVGVQLFAKTGLNDDVNSHANFQNIGFSFLTMFRFSTGENWNGYMHSLAEQFDGCERDPEWRSDWCILPDNSYGTDCVELNGCPNKAVVFFYFTIFTLVVTFVMINLFVGVINDAYSDAQHDEDSDKIAHIFKTWTKDDYDPEGTGFVPFYKLPSLITKLKPDVGGLNIKVILPDDEDDSLVPEVCDFLTYLGIDVADQEVFRKTGMPEAGQQGLNTAVVVLAAQGQSLRALQELPLLQLQLQLRWHYQ